MTAQDARNLVKTAEKRLSLDKQDALYCARREAQDKFEGFLARAEGEISRVARQGGNTVIYSLNAYSVSDVRHDIAAIKNREHKRYSIELLTNHFQSNGFTVEPTSFDDTILIKWGDK